MTPLRAMRLIAAATLLVTVVSGVAMRIVDGREFPTVGKGLWWAAQTVTSVGYGDVVPEETAGRLLALLVMFNAIAFLTVVTGAVTATLLDVRARHSRRELDDRLERIEELLRLQAYADAAVSPVRAGALRTTLRRDISA
jgi:voltage-gated potassium channel